ncbi:hypothetical protein I3843_10G000300 [Carya illinoinensis]|nr:hypothetical protein I3760_10G000200 [Carya illinoinensis]KAG7958054.1 hypothetical protein I3843_10G000300 [Carya illinoinensis]
MRYLGLHLGASFKSVNIWDRVIEKIERRLASCKMIYLTKGGRLTLIKSTFSNLPIYFLSLFLLPARVEKRIESLFRNFLWVGKGDEKKIHLVGWKKVCQPIDCGGLGIKNLSLFNRALLGKWLWRYHLESNAFWKNVIAIKFGSMWGGWCSKDTSRAYGVSLWKFIRKGWGFFSDHIRLKVRDGKRTLLWHDLWCGVSPLKQDFPSRFRIARDQNAAVGKSFCGIDNNIQWNVIFIRDVNDWEVDDVKAFLERIYSSKLMFGREDSMLWIPAGNSKFSFSSFYRLLTCHRRCEFPWKNIWKVSSFQGCFFLLGGFLRQSVEY